MKRPPICVLLDEHAADLDGLLVGAVGPPHGTDCFQETVIAALCASPRFPSADNLRARVFTIAHQRVIDLTRRSMPGPLTPWRAARTLPAQNVRPALRRLREEMQA